MNQPHTTSCCVDHTKFAILVCDPFSGSFSTCAAEISEFFLHRNTVLSAISLSHSLASLLHVSSVFDLERAAFFKTHNRNF